MESRTTSAGRTPASSRRRATSAPHKSPDEASERSVMRTGHDPDLTPTQAKSHGEHDNGEDESPLTARIAASSGTAFDKRVWSLLCQIPCGRVSTYGIMSAHLGSSPRAVGNALRRNPLAPAVPCHRVIATGGTLGGFKGQRPRDGEGITLDQKRALLRSEGVKLDLAGRKVLGTPFSGFV